MEIRALKLVVAETRYDLLGDVLNIASSPTPFNSYRLRFLASWIVLRQAPDLPTDTLLTKLDEIAQILQLILENQAHISSDSAILQYSLLVRMRPLTINFL
jgi:hypothetical protein